jgi:protein-tyrosine phosphatase
MARRRQKRLLFLCTGNYYRSRFAEILFSFVAQEQGQRWLGWSRGLALERGIHNVGPMAASAVTGLERLGIRTSSAWTRPPLPVTVADLERADRIIALKAAEHLPLLRERFPAWAEAVECWQIDDAPGVLPLIEREVLALAARLREESP